MFPKKLKKIHASEEFGILTATWILACNDKNPIMTYRSIQQRLQLDKYPIEAIKTIVQSRGELFRKRIPASYLRRWIEQMQRGEHLPTWLREEDKSERGKLLKDLNLDDVFISQFRADDEQQAWSNGSPLDVMDWGLQHIERLRKASLEARDESIKRWQLWILIIASVVNIFIGIANLGK